LRHIVHRIQWEIPKQSSRKKFGLVIDMIGVGQALLRWIQFYERNQAYQDVFIYVEDEVISRESFRMSEYTLVDLRSQ